MDFNSPSFWIAFWYDVSISPNPALFNYVRENASDPAVRENQYLVIAQRVRYREGYDKEISMKDSEVYKVDLTLMSTSNVFKKGHRILPRNLQQQLPAFARNLNTGGNNYDEKEAVVAHNAVHHSDEYASPIRLPIGSK